MTSPSTRPSFSSLVACGDRVLAVVAGPTRPLGGHRFSTLTAARVETLRRSRDDEIDPRYVSLPEAIEFPTWYEPGT